MESHVHSICKLDVISQISDHFDSRTVTKPYINGYSNHDFKVINIHRQSSHDESMQCMYVCIYIYIYICVCVCVYTVIVYRYGKWKGKCMLHLSKLGYVTVWWFANVCLYLILIKYSWLHCCWLYMDLKRSDNIIFLRKMWLTGFSWLKYHFAELLQSFF